MKEVLQRGQAKLTRLSFSHKLCVSFHELLVTKIVYYWYPYSFH